jgi:hypothetical protein
MKTKNLTLAAMVGAVLVSTVAVQPTTIFAATDGEGASATSVTQQGTKYPIEVMSVVRAYLGGDPNSDAIDNQINELTKVKVMDIYHTFENNTTNGQVIRDNVGKVFNFSLDLMSANNEGNLLSSYATEIMEGVRKNLNGNPSDTSLDAQIMALPKNDVMDKFLSSYGNQILGSDLRRVINEIFGVNLDGISNLEHSRLSIYSKGQWELKSDRDIFAISSSKGDVDLYVGASDYYVEKLGTQYLPPDLEAFLFNQGFTYNTDTKLYSYHNESGQSLPDAFKGLVLYTVSDYIKVHFSDL